MTRAPPSDGAVDWGAARERLARSAAALDGTLRLSADRAKRVLDERAKRMAQPPPRPQPDGECLDAVIFAIGRERYALETRYVLEVIPLADPTPVPGAGGFLLGVINRRGEILAVIDLRRLFGVPPQDLGELSRVVVCGRDGPEFGILADAVLDVRSLAADDVLEPPGSTDGAGRDLLRGVTTDALAVLDGAALLSDRRLFIDQSGEPDGTPPTRGSE